MFLKITAEEIIDMEFLGSKSYDIIDSSSS